MSWNRSRDFLLLAAIMVAAGTYYWMVQHQRRNRLACQLLKTQQVLAKENRQAAVQVEGMVKGIEANVLKNQSQPREVAVLQTCRALQRHTAALLDTLQAYQNLALRQAGLRPGQVPGTATGLASQLVEPVRNPRSADQKLTQYFAAYYALLPTPQADSLRVAAPRLSQQPIIVALSAIAQAESDLLVAEQQLLRALGRQVGAARLKENLLAVASAEANVVRPGETYRARLYVLKQLVLPAGRLQMRCNGQPVPVDERGIGHVRFRVPNHPGPAAWHGTIRYNLNGRDTTFQLTMPYRVARP
jgi:hypothetical protein